MSKAIIWIPFACLAGLIVGAWGPRAELRAMAKQVREEKARPKNVAAEGFKTFAGFAKIPDSARHPFRRRKGVKPLFAGATNRVVAAVATNAASARVQVSASAASTNEPPKRISPDDLRARIEEAQDLWRTRVEIARANWKEKLGLDAEHAARFDAALDEMNEQLYDTMQSMARLVAEKGKVTQESGLRMIGDASTIMAEGYEKVGACVPPEMRETVAEMPMTDFIDPGVAEPLIAVQDKFENLPGDHR